MKYFFVGIKGVGVAGLATLYHDWGVTVSGSDTAEEFFTDRILKELEILVKHFSQDNITRDTDLVIYSTAYNADHLELKRAGEFGIPTQSYTDALAELFNSKKKPVMITGSHGKTTSTAMLGRVLEDASFDPTVVVGGELLEWGRTARAGKSEWIVAEGDEYQAKILMLKPYLLLITNIEYDHPDYYKDEAAYRDAFAKLVASLPDTSYVIAHENLRDFIQNLNPKAYTIFFGGKNDKELLASFNLSVWGEHNRTNALGVLYVAEALGIGREGIIKTLNGFRGTKRRMELYTSDDAPCVIMDDYAHHPTEIRATLAALRERYPGRSITAIFQPHTYSRTKALLDDFARAFSGASHVMLLDIYASAREKEKSIGIEDVVRETKKYHAHVLCAQSLDDAYTQAQQFIQENSVIVTLGAGDVWHVAERIAKKEVPQ